ncbi:hypothetical protein Ga0123462_0833 [Mariprofundus ferrinatatus]|uniref:DUF1778 domain-containing protein n=1 Tax=Mariprofundus ferrinatatus TaxID=1921087 RepID=A0A2K8L3M5_9PROT|nr:hypothetical protein [Mariprofundus ferrinatatus]ATX81702.1 hypothetical protein Ga0123462_0833 [Mariprofundus ferrinatatus]
MNRSEFLIDQRKCAESDDLTNIKLFVLGESQMAAFEAVVNAPEPANDKLVALMNKKSVFE